jgi:hypothetical protein
VGVSESPTIDITIRDVPCDGVAVLSRRYKSHRADPMGYTAGCAARTLSVQPSGQVRKSWQGRLKESWRCGEVGERIVDHGREARTENGGEGGDDVGDMRSGSTDVLVVLNIQKTPGLSR